jgi:hypothetical protein
MSVLALVRVGFEVLMVPEYVAGQQAVAVDGEDERLHVLGAGAGPDDLGRGAARTERLVPWGNERTAAAGVPHLQRRTAAVWAVADVVC